MPSDSNRHHAGKPTACLDCGATAALTDGRFLITGKPCIHHEPSCPTYLAALELLVTDLDWFDAHPGERLWVRPAARCEFDEMFVAVGRRVPRSQRRHWSTLVTRYRSGVNRAYAFDGRVVSIQIVLPDQAGAA